MSVRGDDTFAFKAEPFYSGIRQDLPTSGDRWRLIQNGHLNNIGSITKDLGVRRITETLLGNGAEDTVMGIDAHFNNGSQHLIVFQNSGTDMLAYKFNTVGSSWAQQSPTFAQKTPSTFMFANALVVLDGTTLRAMNSSNVWSTPGDADYSNPCKFGTVYANRAVISGHATYPYTFFPSDSRTNTWDVDESVDVTSTYGEQITAIFKCGQFLIVGGRTFTRAYYLGSANSKDWDWDELSSLTGPVDFKSTVEVSLTRGNVHNNYSFFYGDQGPMMIAQQGGALPSLIPMWESLEKSFRGTEHEDVPAIDITTVDQIQCNYVPELREIRFAAIKKTTQSSETDPRKDIMYCLHLPSAIAFAQSGMDPRQAPAWRLRHNVNMEFPASTLFQCQVNPDTGAPSTTGQMKLMSARDGYVYEMDAKYTYQDQGDNIDFRIRYDGIDGEQDGVDHYTKSAQDVFFKANQVGDYTLYIQIVGDGKSSSIQGLELSEDSVAWSASTEDGTWGDGADWNEGGFAPFRAKVGALGKKFDVDIYDYGAISAELQLSDLEVGGMIEGAR